VSLSNRVQFTVEFDSAAWGSMSSAEQQAWLDRVLDMLADEVYVSEVALDRP
jgi:hypothetical protein